MTKYLILIIPILCFFNTIMTDDDCLPSNVHITLGDYFANRQSNIIYRVGFM